MTDILNTAIIRRDERRTRVHASQLPSIGILYTARPENPNGVARDAARARLAEVFGEEQLAQWVDGMEMTNLEPDFERDGYIQSPVTGERLDVPAVGDGTIDYRDRLNERQQQDERHIAMTGRGSREAPKQNIALETAILGVAMAMTDDERLGARGWVNDVFNATIVVISASKASPSGTIEIFTSVDELRARQGPASGYVSISGAEAIRFAADNRLVISLNGPGMSYTFGDGE
jgi:hypothetical protein